MQQTKQSNGEKELNEIIQKDSLTNPSLPNDAPLNVGGSSYTNLFNEGPKLFVENKKKAKAE